MKLQLLLEKWLRKREEGQDPAMNWSSPACEAFWAACMAIGQPQPKRPQHTALQMQFCPLAGAAEPHAVSFKGRSKDCQCPWGNLRKPASSPVPSSHALLQPLSGASQHRVPACISQCCANSGVITPNSSLSYSHLGCTSVCSTAYLPARDVQRKLFHFCRCCFPSSLPGKNVQHSFMGVGSGTQCCAHPHLSSSHGSARTASGAACPTQYSQGP